MDFIRHLYSALLKLIASAIVLLTVVMSLVVLGQVVLRYIVDHPFSWTEEMARVTFLLWTLLGAVLAYKGDRHMGLNIVEVRLAEKPRQIFILIRNLLVLAFCAVMFWQGIILVSSLSAATPILRLPFSKIYLILPFMSACIFIMCVVKIVGNIIDIKRLYVQRKPDHT